VPFAVLVFVFDGLGLAGSALLSGGTARRASAARCVRKASEKVPLTV